MANNIVRINDTVSNPKLRELLVEFKQKHDTDKNAAVKVLNELANEFVFSAKVLCPVQLSAEPVKQNGVLTAKSGSQVSFMLLSENDKSYLPLFTDNDEYSKWSFGVENPPYTLVLDFSGIAAIFESNAACSALVLNPYSDNLLIQREMIIKWNEDAQIKQHGHARHTITADTPAEVYALNPYPMLLSNKLCETAKGLPGINAMWLRGIKLNGEDGYLLLADLSEDGNNGIFKALGECATPLLDGKALHIVTTDNDFGKKNVDNVLPIYSKNG